MFEQRSQKTAPKCGQCGRILGIGFYYTCHVCGAAYCYAHAPEKCDHQRSNSPPMKVALRKEA